ncbi:ricin-type beta-trefoil lectin domain protein, partial [Actinospica sp.]|uniref:ricin-type beta-trefoil lectin domain protein n=1 Tax=Actinospica sp. TaxID=1872142 RepID=UPI002BC521D5
MKQRFIAVVAAVALALGMGTALAHHAQAASGTGQITGYQGLCLDDRSASSADSNPIQVYTCNGTGAQQWTVGS